MIVCIFIRILIGSVDQVDRERVFKNRYLFLLSALSIADFDNNRIRDRPMLKFISFRFPESIKVEAFGDYSLRGHNTYDINR